MKEKLENEIEELDSMLVTKKTKYQFDRDQLNYQCIMLQKKHADSENVFQKCKRKRDKVERKLKEKREEFDVKSLKNDKELALIQKEAAASLKRFKEIQSKKDYFDNFDKERYLISKDVLIKPALGDFLFISAIIPNLSGVNALVSDRFFCENNEDDSKSL